MRKLVPVLVAMFALGTIGCGAASQQTKAVVVEAPPTKKLMKKKKKSNRMEMVIEDE